MVDEIPEEGGGGGGGGGSVLKKYGPLAAIVLLVQIVLAWAIITFFFKGNALNEDQGALLPQATEVTSSGQQQERVNLPFYYASEKLENMTANPAGTNASRFVMFSVQLGLVAKDSSGEDITDNLQPDDDTHIKLALYDSKIKATIVQVMRFKTIDQLSAELLPEVKADIRQQLNENVFKKIFALTDKNEIEVLVEEVVFSDIIIQ